MNTLRVAVLSTAIIATPVFSTAGPAGADPPPTEVITTVAVGPSGKPINGYREAPQQGTGTGTVDCTEPSPSAVADNVYSCSPSAAGANTCWPSTPGSMLCVNGPWDQQLHRVTYRGQLPPVQHPATPEPFALVLDDGTRCLLRNGGSWSGRFDGYQGAYGCGDSGGSNPAVLCLPGQACIDRSAPVWTVKVGELRGVAIPVPPPQTHAVTSAWVAGSP